MNRERITWLASGAIICYLALQVPGSLGQRDQDFSFVRTLIDVYRNVDMNYVEPVERKKLETAAINGMLKSLDEYTMYVPPDKQDEFNDALDGNFKGVGIRLSQNEQGQIEVVTPIDDSPAWKAGILPGDVIVKVNGESILGLRLEDVIPKIQGPSGTPVTLTILRRQNEQTVDITMTRQEYQIPMVKGFGRNQDQSWDFWADHENKIAYVRLTQFTPEVGQRITSILNQLLKEGMKGLIFDVRFNPGGRLQEAEQLIDLFVKEGVMVTVKGRSRAEQKKLARAEGTLPDFPMVVLINEHSASASEVLAGALKDLGRATVVGARSYGKGSVQEVVPLDANAGELKITVAYWYLPSGKRVQRLKDATEWGVEPDIVVPMDDAAQARLMTEQLNAERMWVSTTAPAATQPVAATQPIDPQLDRAVAVIREKLGLASMIPTTAPTTEPAATQPAD